MVYFCQPEGCISAGRKHLSLRDTTSFVFTLTDKDSGKVRYGVCLNFFRPIERDRTKQRKGGTPKSRSSNLNANSSLTQRTDPYTTDSSADCQGGTGQGQAHGQSPLQSPLQSKESHADEAAGKFSAAGSPTRQPPTEKLRRRTHSLTSLCLISHHAFLSRFRELLHMLRRKIEVAQEDCARAMNKAGVRYVLQAAVCGSGQNQILLINY